MGKTVITWLGGFRLFYQNGLVPGFANVWSALLFQTNCCVQYNVV